MDARNLDMELPPLYGVVMPKDLTPSQQAILACHGLIPGTVRAIRASTLNPKAAARLYRVSVATVKKIRSGHSYAWVED